MQDFAEGDDDIDKGYPTASSEGSVDDSVNGGEDDELEDYPSDAECPRAVGQRGGLS